MLRPDAHRQGGTYHTAPAMETTDTDPNRRYAHAARHETGGVVWDSHPLTHSLSHLSWHDNTRASDRTA